ncbi:unnamed protein product [Vicia faba]|uniref:Transmembrane protein n=1 Tax=Vicia faba TaxID=3906 RepID=A0AAV1AGN5_VICFA|nr:unnamed protein product [Vicia faba]
MVWNKVASWLGVLMVNLMGVVENLLWFRNSLVGKVRSRKKLLIWLATCWALWSMRNVILFKSVIFNVGEVVDKIKLFSWLWNVIGLKSKVCCSFYLWSRSPLDFLNIN